MNTISTNDEGYDIISDIIALKDDQIYCKKHKKEHCTECDINYVDINMLSKAFSLNQGYLPPPDPNIQRQIDVLKKAGNEKYKQKQYSSAIKNYTNAITLSRTRPIWDKHDPVKEEISVLLSNRAASYIEQEDYFNALFDAEATIKVNPNWPKGFFRKGRALLGLAQYGQAIEAFETALMLSDGKNADVSTYLKEAQKFAY